MVTPPLPEGGTSMIIVTRRKDQALVIGDNIVVTIVDIRGDKVRLGIEHPPEVPVHRQEVYEAITRARPTLSSTSAEAAPPQPPPDRRQES
jgi:carbon storage regulator